MRDETLWLLRKYAIICQYKHTIRYIDPDNAGPAIQGT